MSKTLFAVLGWFLVGACVSLEPPTGDIIPPTVYEFYPKGDQVSLDTQVWVLFTEPVDSGVAQEGLVVVAPAGLVDDSFLEDLDHPPLSSKRSEIVVSCATEIDVGGSRVVLKPTERLQSSTLYLVVVSSAVRDLSGNPLVADLRVDENGRVIGIQSHLLHEFTTGW